jgi:hypothetical protein
MRRPCLSIELSSGGWRNIQMKTQRLPAVSLVRILDVKCNLRNHFIKNVLLQVKNGAVDQTAAPAERQIC